jgi:Tfp pilus assembly protein PilZ
VNGVTNTGKTEDFSMKGLFIKTHRNIPLGSILHVAVHLPDGSISKLKGKVSRISGRPEGVGIEIIERDSNYLQFMLSFIK